MRRPIVTTLSACALALAAAAPAAAFGTSASGSLDVSDNTAVTRSTVNGVFSVASSTLDTLSGVALNQSGSAQVLSDDGETQQVLVQCSSSAPGAAGIGVYQCFLQTTGPGREQRFDAIDGNAVPGVLDATISEVLTVPSSGYEVCVQSRALMRDGSRFVETPLVCS